MIYLLPLVFFGILIIDRTRIDALFWALFLVSLLPCSLVGIVLTAIGLAKSVKNKNQFNKMVGLSGMFWGFLLLCGGVLAWALLYVVLH